MFSFLSASKALVKPAPVFFRHSVITGVLISSFLAGFYSNALAAKRNTDSVSSVTQPSGVNPDQLLIETYQALSNNQLNQAEQKIDALLAAYPNYQLAHLIRGDLLLMHTQKVTGFGAMSHVPPDKLKELRDEAAARLKAIQFRPGPNQVPRSVLQLRDDQKQVIVIDAKKSRLFLFDHLGNQQLQLRSDHYISQGKFGVDKLKEGDQKTPLGVYYITSRLSGSKLPDFYGPGALPLNYPNEWDKVNGRSGSGIWLHGMPSNSFSRPPLASDGCVVLTNPDFLNIAAQIEIGRTPVVIAEQLEFTSREKLQQERQQLAQVQESWRLDMESMNANRIFANYSRNFRSPQGEDLNSWFAKQRPSWEGWSNPVVKLKDITQFRYPARDEMLVTTFTMELSSGRSHMSTRKRQYWIKEATKWRIIYETNV
ncbi:L,D-transpeptidase family protein [Undibacterium luofuense]|uniref:L,D-transpeptidase family protein n=1 Tax=Undibacterium luofuense TaxID=2828733 RepID=A0A941DN46_9BURK|nr:L,D-transpeptidase family protein [Undibacterium luofuense]MBR7783059.1 L,D-transpeptidase family protein [Undibacterium luofuense]